MSLMEEMIVLAELVETVRVLVITGAAVLDDVTHHILTPDRSHDLLDHP